MVAKFRNAGQSCIGANRFLVHERVFDEFTADFASRIDAMSIGDGLADPVPDLGPCIDAHRAREVEAMVGEAMAGGGRLLTKKGRRPGPGLVPTGVAGQRAGRPVMARRPRSSARLPRCSPSATTTRR